MPIIIALLFMMGIFISKADARPLSSLEERGKVIYSTGKSPSGKSITAWFGKDLLEVPGTSATCASCHGYDGGGRTESGITATPVTWAYLMKSYGHLHGDGLRHEAFDPDSLRSYLRDGVYPGEVRGNPAMPVYDIDDSDLDALLSYLRRLGSEADPGLTSRVVRVGIVSPSTGAGKASEAVMRETVEEYFREINLRGGIYGRKIEVVSVEGDVDPSGEASVRLAQEKDVFAFVAGSAAAVSGDLPAGGDRVPWVGPIGARDKETGLPAAVFYLTAGSTDEAGALAVAASEHVATKESAVVVYSATTKDAAEHAAGILRRSGWNSVSLIGCRDVISGSLGPGSSLDAVLVLANPGEGAAVVRAAARIAPQAGLFVAAAEGESGIVFSDLPAMKRFFTSPLPLQWTDAAGAARFRKLTPGDLETAPLRISSLVAAMVLAEGLKASGRELGRERLVLSLEKLYRFETGFAPAITFGKNIRNGLSGVYVYGVGEGRKVRNLGWYRSE